MGCVLANIYHTHCTVIFLLVALGLLYLAWVNRFVQDDAFISFRYAENLATGNGLVWNPGERVEGYSNFLWTLAISFAMRVGAEPVSASIVMGRLLFSVTLFYTYKTGEFLLGSSSRGAAAMLLLGTNYTFSAYATGGLETQLQACLFLLCAYKLLTISRTGKIPRTGALFSLSVLMSAAVLTRLDSVLLIVVILPAAAFSVLWLKRLYGTEQGRYAH